MLERRHLLLKWEMCIYILLFVLRYEMRVRVVYKGRHSQSGERVCPVRTFYVQGDFRCGCSHFFAQKLRIFRNLWCVRTDKGKLSQCGHFANKGGGDRIFADVLYGRPRMRTRYFSCFDFTCILQHRPYFLDKNFRGDIVLHQQLFHML